DSSSGVAASGGRSRVGKPQRGLLRRRGSSPDTFVSSHYRDTLFIATIMVARKRQAAEDYPDALCYYQDAAKPKASGAGASSWHSGNLFTDGPIGAGSNRERNS